MVDPGSLTVAGWTRGGPPAYGTRVVSAVTVSGATKAGRTTRANGLTAFSPYARTCQFAGGFFGWSNTAIPTAFPATVPA